MLSQANKPANWSQKINIIHFNFLKKCLSQLDKGAIKIHFWKKLGIWPNQRTPSPPPPRKLGRQKKKNKFIVYFAF